MSEKKFRAWDKINNVMIPWEDIYPLFSDNARLFFLLSGNLGGYIAEQYTGLHDKNGKEICEGDIIKGDLYDYRLPTMGEVVYDLGFSTFANKNEAGNTFLFKINNIEIIGNIHENPELLEADK